MNATNQAGYSIPDDVKVSAIIEEAKAEFYQDPNVIGVGIGHRRKGDETHADEIALIVYVASKLPQEEVKRGYVIPPSFRGMNTDVVAPFGGDAPKDALGFAEGHEHSDGMSFVDWPRLHAQWTAGTAGTAGTIASHGGDVLDFGDVCVIEDDVKS